MTTHVASVDWSFADHPFDPSPRWNGLARNVLVGPGQGAVHTELAVGQLAPGGWLNRHFHSFEESLYVLGGELLLEVDGHHHRLAKGDYALMPVGAWHALANDGGEPTRPEMTRGRALEGSFGGHAYVASVPAARAAGDYTPRLVSYHPEARMPLEAPYILWQR